jgi:hypothetical protein
MDNKIEDLQFKSGSVSLSDSDRSVEIIMNGEIDLINPEQEIGPFFNEVHNMVIAGKIDMVTLNLVNLAFLNSSGIKVLIIWIMKVVRMDPDVQYRITINGNVEHEWQLNSVPMLCMISPDLVVSNL